MSPLLSHAITATLILYGVAILLALWRVLRGPTAQDRVLALDFIYLIAMLIILVIGIRYGSLFDSTQTMVTKIDDDTYQVQVVSWYDNENSYTSQMVRTIKYFAELG